MWNKLKKNLTSRRIFFFEIFVISILFLILLSLSLEVSFSLFIKIFIGLIVIDTLVVYFIGRRRNKEMEEIRSIINSIRKNKFAKAEEIHLSAGLSELEDEIKKMFAKTKNDIENLEKLERIRTEFLGNVSHELRTPIFGIQGYLETLLNGAIHDDSVNEKFVEKAARHAENLNSLLNDLIDISMIESGQMKMSFRYFNALEYFSAIVDEMKGLAEEKGIKLLLGNIKPKLQLFGDKARLRQVMVNLISNAIKYTEKGNVTLSVEEGANEGTVIVEDTGIGISEENLSRIFERFYRVDKDRSRAIGGTGLGLAIVKHILEAHNSKIMIESKLGEGSRFSFKLKK